MSAWSGESVTERSPAQKRSDIHRAPPHSVEGEQGVLSSMLLSPREGIAEAAEKIDRKAFYVPAHR